MFEKHQFLDLENSVKPKQDKLTEKFPTKHIIMHRKMPKLERRFGKLSERKDNLPANN